MKARSVNENVNFERGQDPKEAMGIGWDVDKYIDGELEKRGHGDIDFWGEFQQATLEDHGPEELLEMIIEMLEHTSPEYQKKWADGYLSNYN